MSLLVRPLRKVGELQARYPEAVVGLALIVTIIMAFGVPDISLQTDLSEELPEGVPVIELMEEVGAKFGDTDSIILLVSVDENTRAEDPVTDIRDPRVLEVVRKLDLRLSQESDISRTSSISTLLRRTGVPPSLERSKATWREVEGEEFYFNSDYSSTILYGYADLGSKNERIKELVAEVRRDIKAVPVPPGIEVTLTGQPLMSITLFDLLVNDATTTISLAALIIFMLLLITQRPYYFKAVLIFIPLVIALTWTMGTMGWFDIPLSIGTVGVGGMILGLGVEYGVFMVRRYQEIRGGGKNQVDTLGQLVPGVGLAITGSATTTMTGFLALLMASMPMIQHMGATLALGIFYSYVAAVMVNPALFVLSERIFRRRWPDG